MPDIIKYAFWNEGELDSDEYTIEIPARYLPVTTITLERRTPRKPKQADYQRIQPDMTIKIPNDVAERLHWGVGSEVWVDTYDEDLSQAIVGKRVRGEEAKKAMRKLQRMMSDQ